MTINIYEFIVASGKIVDIDLILLNQLFTNHCPELGVTDMQQYILNGTVRNSCKFKTLNEFLNTRGKGLFKVQTNIIENTNTERYLIVQVFDPLRY